ncbi:unnamed protein product [Lepeophtheirus salmonis]|uniref:(salmon louse) hypothetical protein n=1 Tax=Lepeophtheirus salmonis TaxID=72036 RepID=A0A7R8H9R6_LEPSM|nr:unnamed protein product [Lepeophtheirus salmonis]CAF2959617.1 unnamed protein product [Lepeophtheirus salmonis]
MQTNCGVKMLFSEIEKHAKLTNNAPCSTGEGSHNINHGRHAVWIPSGIVLFRHSSYQGNITTSQSTCLISTLMNAILCPPPLSTWTEHFLSCGLAHHLLRTSTINVISQNSIYTLQN